MCCGSGAKKLNKRGRPMDASTEPTECIWVEDRQRLWKILDGSGHSEVSRCVQAR